MSLTSCLIVMLGGALGSLGRYVVSILAAPISRNLPWGTIFVNASGSFIIGFFSALTLASGRLPASENLRLFVMIGICGGYTTFSSFSLQTLDLLRAGSPIRACLNISVSVVICIALVALGHTFGTWLNGSPIQITDATVEEEI